MGEGALKISALIGDGGGWEIEGRMKADLRAAGAQPSLSWSWGQARGIIGAGALGRGQAFRKSPYARAKSAGSLPWSTAGSDQIVGFKVGDLSIAWEAAGAAADEEETASSGSGNRDPSLLSSPRLAVLELEMVRNATLALAASLQMSRLPKKNSGSGWKPGPGSRLSQTLLGLSLSAERRSGEAKMGIWASGICGSLVRPSMAASFQADTGHFGLGKSGPGGFEVRLACFVYASLKEYLDVEGGLPAWDRLLDASVEAGGENWGLEVGLLSYSRNSDSGDTVDLRLMKPDTPGLQRLLWRWRTDLISCSLSGRLGGLRASLKAKADGEGLASGSAAMKFDPPHRGNSWSWSLGGEARLGRRGASESDGPEEDDPDEDAEQASGAGILYLKRIGVVVDLKWSDSGRILERSSLSLACFAARGETGWEPAAEFQLQAGLRLGKKLQAALKLSTPSGGYPLTKLPDELPSLSVGFGLGRELP